MIQIKPQPHQDGYTYFYTKKMINLKYLLNKRSTTHIMTNIRAIPTNTPIIAGSRVLVDSSTCFTAGMYDSFYYLVCILLYAFCA